MKRSAIVRCLGGVVGVLACGLVAAPALAVLPRPKPDISPRLPPPRPDMLADSRDAMKMRENERVAEVAQAVRERAAKEAARKAARTAATAVSPTHSDRAQATGRVAAKNVDGDPVARPVARPVACAIENAEYERVATPETENDACVVPVPVRLAALRGANDIALRPHPLLDCRMASDFSRWVHEVVAPAARLYLGSPLVAVRVAASYHCRRRNNLPTGKMSEHATGDAIDISAFRLANGKRVAVRGGFDEEGDVKEFMTRIRTAACARFLTVLSPLVDPFHKDHIHLDQGCHGKTCTYRICQ